LRYAYNYLVFFKCGIVEGRKNFLTKKEMDSNVLKRIEEKVTEEIKASKNKRIEKFVLDMPKEFQGGIEKIFDESNAIVTNYKLLRKQRIG